MSRFNTAEIDMLKVGEELLSREVRACDMRHEDVRRNAQGDVLAPATYVPECAFPQKHFGCPHYLFQARDGIEAALDVLFRQGDTRCMKLKEELASLTEAQLKLDTRIREVRIGGNGNLNVLPGRIPHVRDTKEKVKEHLDMFNIQCALLDAVRKEALGKIQDALQPHFASPETDE